MVRLIFGLCLIAGCAIDVESTSSEPVEIIDNEEQMPETPDHGMPQNFGCPGDLISLGDGSVVELPGLCDMFEIYKGYPDPTIEKEMESVIHE